MVKIINISKEFSYYPMGRNSDDGPDNGKRFYKSFLKPFLDNGEKVTVIFDGVRAFGSSFLDEAFHEMPAQDGVSRSNFTSSINIVAEGHAYLFYKVMAESFMKKIPK